MASIGAVLPKKRCEMSERDAGVVTGHEVKKKGVSNRANER